MLKLAYFLNIVSFNSLPKNTPMDVRKNTHFVKIFVFFGYKKSFQIMNEKDSIYFQIFFSSFLGLVLVLPNGSIRGSVLQHL
jgi:hypothetical protein